MTSSHIGTVFVARAALYLYILTIGACAYLARLGMTLQHRRTRYNERIEGCMYNVRYIITYSYGITTLVSNLSDFVYFSADLAKIDLSGALLHLFLALAWTKMWHQKERS